MRQVLRSEGFNTTEIVKKSIFQFAMVLFAAAFTSSVAQAQSAPAAPQVQPHEPRFVVVIDAAHGGDDKGAQLPNNEFEKQITLALSVRLRSLLAARGIAVVTTRESDNAVDNDHRLEAANRAQATACISIHATPSGTGAHLFTSALAPSPAGEKITAWKTAQAAWVQQSTALAGVVNSELQQAGVNVTLARTSMPVLDSLACPAIALELAKPTAPEGNAPPELRDPAYLAHVAEALVAALIEWRSEVKRP